MDRSRMRCMDCGVNCFNIGEVFSLRHEIRTTAIPNGNGFLCVGCAEARLKRQLRPADFTEAAMNHPYKLPKPLQRIWHQSERLRNRLEEQA